MNVPIILVMINVIVLLALGIFALGYYLSYKDVEREAKKLKQERDQALDEYIESTDGIEESPDTKERLKKLEKLKASRYTESHVCPTCSSKVLWLDPNAEEKELAPDTRGLDAAIVKLRRMPKSHRLF